MTNADAIKHAARLCAGLIWLAWVSVLPATGQIPHPSSSASANWNSARDAFARVGVETNSVIRCAGYGRGERAGYDQSHA